MPWSLFYYSLIVGNDKVQKKNDNNEKNTKVNWIQMTRANTLMRNGDNLTVRSARMQKHFLPLFFFRCLFVNLSLLMWLCTGDVKPNPHPHEYWALQCSLSWFLVHSDFNKAFLVDSMTFTCLRPDETDKMKIYGLSFRRYCHRCFFSFIFFPSLSPTLSLCPFTLKLAEHFKIARSYSHLFGASLN